MAGIRLHGAGVLSPKYAFYACYGLIEPADWIPFAVGVSIACIGVIGADLLRWME